MKRGDLVTVSWYGFAGKPRPAVIVQGSCPADFTSLTVCPTTTREIEAELLRLPVEPDALNNLRSRSWVMVEKITTVPVGKVGKRIGALDPEILRRLDEALLVHLGFSASGSAPP